MSATATSANKHIYSLAKRKSVQLHYDHLAQLPDAPGTTACNLVDAVSVATAPSIAASAAVCAVRSLAFYLDRSNAPSFATAATKTGLEP